MIGGIVPMRDEHTGRGDEGRLEALVRNALDVITILSVDGTVLYESPAVERVLGYTPAELIGTDPFARIHHDDVARIRRLFADALAKPSTNVPAEFRTAQGRLLALGGGGCH